MFPEQGNAHTLTGSLGGPQLQDGVVSATMRGQKSGTTTAGGTLCMASSVQSCARPLRMHGYGKVAFWISTIGKIMVFQASMMITQHGHVE